MPFNGSGVFQRVRNWVADATAGIKIRADYHDAEDDGFAAGLTNCITKDGQTLVTQNIPFNSKRITGLADPINDQDAATKKYADVAFKTGGKMTGDLEVEKDHPVLTLDDTDAAGAEIVFQHAGKTRWIVRMNADVETGTGNTGSNFDIQRFADDGTTMLEQALLINRADGRTTINGDLYSVRSATEGVIYLGSDSAHYLHWSGTNYAMPGAKLILGAQGASGNDAVTFDQLNTKQASLGFTPVQQGGGNAQGTNKVYIGWGTSGGLRAQVDATDLGPFLFGGSSIINLRWLGAGASYPPGTATGVWQDPFPNSVIYLYVTAGGTVISGFQHKWLQAYTSSWFTIGS